MHLDRRVDFININKSEERHLLLNKYCNLTEFIDKDSYEGLMRDDSIRKKFGASIQLYVHTWNNLILKEYFQVLPDSIKKLKNKFLENEEYIEKMRENMINRMDELRRQEDELNEMIRDPQFNITRPETIEIIRDKRLKQLKNDIIALT